MNAAVTDLYEIVIKHTDFLTDLPAYKDATDETVADAVDEYISVAEDISGHTCCHSTVKSLTFLAWSEIDQKEVMRRLENERAERPSRPEYSFYANAN